MNNNVCMYVTERNISVEKVIKPDYWKNFGVTKCRLLALFFIRMQGGCKEIL